MRTKRFVTYTIVTVVVVVVAYMIFRKRAADEEAPIIVRNGSMDILAGDNAPKNKHWKWNRNPGGGNPVFVHEANYPHSKLTSQPLNVYLMGTPSARCNTNSSAPSVRVTFGDDFSITLSRVQLGSSGQFRTRVEGSSSELSEVVDATRPTLRHRSSDATQVIKSLTVGTMTCTFNSASDLTRICISPDDPTEACEG